MKQARIFLALLLLYSGAVFAKAPAFHYLAPDSVNLKALLPAPPASGSPENKSDIEAVLAHQASRTVAEVARARSEEHPAPGLFATVLGSGFTATNLPVTFALLDEAGADADAIAATGKKIWARPRPPLQDPAIHPAIELPTSYSYPSGHSTLGMVWAIILTKLDPAMHIAILARGRQIGEDRIIGGVHFPTDVAAGRKLGRFLAARFFENPHFEHDLFRAEVELELSPDIPWVRCHFVRQHYVGFVAHGDRTLQRRRAIRPLLKPSARKSANGASTSSSGRSTWPKLSVATR